ncbi:hypothetical protein [Paenibacillus algicola]|uniref:hypothetical protein n=1 Tax=Paenibacillus algicola TaxID=2565926 RepID=UPI001C2F57B6|nr:hypothetical protein [Paenibacillus algicola]
MVIVSIIGLVVVWYGVSAKIETLNEDLAALTKQNETYKAENTSLKKDQESMREAFELIRNVVLMNTISHSIEGAVVTDDFIVEKVYFNVGENGNLNNVVIDVDNQPDMAYVYEGKGAYELTDREVRAKSDAIIDAVIERYASTENLPLWDDNTYVSVTVKNYEIGTKQSGEFKLIGENK